MPRGSHPGSPHRPHSCGLANAGYGPWDLLGAPAGTKTCGPAGWPSRSGPAYPWSSPACRFCHASRLPAGYRAAPSRVPVPETLGSPGAPHPRRGRPLDLVASAIRWAVVHLPLVRGRHEPRPGWGWLAQLHQAREDPRAWGGCAALPGSVRLHWGAQRAGPLGVLTPRPLGYQPGPGEQPVPAASAHWGPGRAGRSGGEPPGPPGGSRMGASRKHALSSV